MESLFSNSLNKENYEILCYELYSAESEIEIISLLNTYGLWVNDKNWVNYGDVDNNVAIIGNQTTSPEAAIVEKFTNSIDAVLMKESKLKNIDPKSKDAPQSMEDAMELFYNVKDKNIKNTSKEVFEYLKQQIYLVATGDKKKPNLAIIDRGEGQTPNNLSETILSLKKTNKIEIKFVQGQFNQGGTAVLPFCGTNRLQLIISKRNQNISDKNDNSHDKWGFTIVRRNSSDQNSRNTKYEYLVIDDKIPSFKKDYLQLIPKGKNKPREEKLESGTYIKLFEYNLTVGSVVTMGLTFHLSMLLAGAKIPINMFEYRAFEKKNINSSLMYGHFYRFQNTPQHIEKGFPFSFSMEIENQHMDIMIICLKQNKKRAFKTKEGVLFTLNGQTQGIMSDTFFDRKSVGLGYLKDSLMVFIDASKLDVAYREDLFMSNRQHTRDIPFRRKIEKYLEIELSQNKMLKSVQNKRREEMLKEQANDSSIMKKTITKLLKTSPSLNTLFNKGIDFSDINEKDSNNNENLFSFEGKEYPSYFKLKTAFTEEEPKICPQNKSFRIEFKTDVEDLYFLRTNYRGIYSFSIENYKLTEFSFRLRQGKAIFTGSLPEDVIIGEKLTYSYTISNTNPSIGIFTGYFCVEVTPPQNNKNNEPTEKKPPKQQTLDLPTLREVRKENWDKHNFNEYDALDIKPNNKNYDFYINMDNKYIALERKRSKIDEIRINELYKGAMLIFALSMLDDTEESDIQAVSNSAKSLAKVCIPIINLSDIYTKS